MKHVLVLTSIFLFIIFIGCSTHIHTIGDGPQTNQKAVKRQWYALYGIISLNDIDVNQMADNAENYEISSKFSFLDGCIITFCGGGLIGSRTVTVKY